MATAALQGRALASASITDPLADTFSLFLLQVVVILCACKLSSVVLARFNVPAVVGEMVAGVILGPTVLGRIPGWMPTLFPAYSLGALSTISTFGLTFFMFSVGLEMDLAKVARHARVSSLLTLCGVGVPAAASYALALLFLKPEYSTTSLGLLGLFLTCVLGITSLPMLARMLGEREMLHSPIGDVVMSVAVLEDIVSYVLLAILIVLLSATSQLGILWVVLLCCAEMLALVFVARPLIRLVVARAEAMHSSKLQPTTFLLLSLILLFFCLVTNIIGLTYVSFVLRAAALPPTLVPRARQRRLTPKTMLHTHTSHASQLIGAFQVGLIFPRDSKITEQLSAKVEGFTLVILMPLYFAYSGLRTDFGLIDSGEAVGLCALLIAVAAASKAGAVYLGCRYSAIPPVMSRIVSVVVTCKGLVALVTVNIGLSAKAITPKFFAILVLFVLLSTVMTIPLVDLVSGSKEQRAAELAAFGAAHGEGAGEGAAVEGGAEAEHAALAVVGEGVAGAVPRQRTRTGSSSSSASEGLRSALATAPPSPSLPPLPAAAAQPPLLPCHAPAQAQRAPEHCSSRSASPTAAPAADAAAAAAPPPPHRLLLAVTDPVNAPRLATLANLTTPARAALQVLWLPSDASAPSAYMHSAASLREPALRRALAACAPARTPEAGSLAFSTLPSASPWEAALARAATALAPGDVLLCSHRLPAASAGLGDALGTLSAREWSALLGLRGEAAAEAGAAAVAGDRRPALRACVRAAGGGHLRAALAVYFGAGRGAQRAVRRAVWWGGAGVAEFLALVPEAGGGVALQRAAQPLALGSTWPGDVEAWGEGEGQGGGGEGQGGWGDREDEGEGEGEGEGGGGGGGEGGAPPPLPPPPPLALLSGDAEEGEGEEAQVARLESWLCLCAARGASALVVFRGQQQRQRGVSLREEGAAPPAAAP